MPATTIPTPPQETAEKNEIAAKKKVAEKYNSYLSAQGFKAEIDNDGDVRFITEGLQFFILIDPLDENYFRVALPSIWTAEDQQQLQSMLPLANSVSADVKGVKLVSRSRYKSVWGYSEMFLVRPDDYQAIFQRVIGSLQYAARTFRDKITAKQPEKVGPG